MRLRNLSIFTALVFVFSVADTRGQLQLGHGKQADGSYRQGGDAQLVLDGSVRTELGLTKEQDEKIKAAIPKLGAMARDASKKLSPDVSLDDLYKPYNELSASLVTDVLTDKQRARFKQIVYQARGLEPFFREEVRKSLKLTEAQNESLTALKASFAEDLKAGLANTRKQNNELNRVYQAKTIQLLTDGQKMVWASLIGAPYRLPDGPSKGPHD